MSKFESSPITKEFRNQVKTFLPDSKSVVAGISGGPDSMALIYLLHRFNIPAIVVHCNYQLRGEASDKDQKLVEDICMHWKLECISIRFDSAKESTGNFQEWARERRYQAFRDIKKEYGAGLILTAHHQDDQLETILQKILRGSGLSSWKGMDILENDLFRPLLNLSKSGILDFVEEFNVPYRIDRTNEESTYARNFIRNHWFPDLNRLFPGWKQNLLKVTDRAEEFEAMADLILQQVSTGKDMLKRSQFLDLPQKIKPVVLLQFFKKYVSGADVSQGFLNNLDDLSELQSGSKLQISECHFLYRDRDLFKVIVETSDHDINQKIKKGRVEESFVITDLEFSIKPVPESYSVERLHLDQKKLKFPLTLRTWKDGDSFQPLGMKGSQLVSDHLTNRKIPSSVKKDALVLESFDTTICAVIFPNSSNSSEIGTISEKYRCVTATEKTLTITKIS